ncbi:MAG: T9SS type A sorting domain-containing protein, partial [Bacteroidetes bacterium]|nr:T9SS type A sorting domain-containing protein [Bacteroidota bacterium]
VLLGKRVISVSTGSAFTLALTSDGKVYSWGYGGYLGNSNYSQYGSYTPVQVDTMGALLGKKVVQIATGNEHSMVLTSDGKIITWGKNDSGQLGIGTKDNSLLPIEIPNFNLTNIQNDVIVKSFMIYQNYPNPFNPATTIRYCLQSTTSVRLVVYDLLGREVKTLVNEVQQAGEYTVPFYAHGLSSGVYFYKIITPEFSEMKKMVLLK